MRRALSAALATVLAASSLAASAIAEEAAADAPVHHAPVHHALVQKKVGFYAVYLPPGYEAEENAERRYPVCVILHGSGSTETGHGALSNQFGREGVIYVAPRAPHAHPGVFIEGQKPGWTAWPPYPEAWGAWDSEGFPTEAVEKLAVERLYTDWIADCVTDARRRYRCDDQRVLVVGHSQGAAFAHLLAVHRPELVRAYFAYAGSYDGSLADDAAAIALKKHGVGVALAHCEGDAVVPAEHTEKLAAYLKERGVPHDVLIEPRGTHGFTSRVTRAAHAFVAKLGRNEELPPLRGELVVVEVVPDSQAAAIALRAGDVLISYDGAALTNRDDLVTAAGRERPDDATIELVWRRGEETMKATVKPGTIGVHLEDR